MIVTFRNIVAALRARSPQLARFGFICLAFAALCFAATFVDARQLNGVNVWMKPGKFFLSVGVFALTAAWFFGLVRPERRGAALMRGTVWTLILAGGFEVAYITLQAARAEASHFNVSDTFHIVMYALMGISAVILIGMSLPLAWEIARRPIDGADPDYRFAVILGLVMTFVLGGALGGYMSAQSGHSVGSAGGNFPLFGWNRIGGDLRVAHFFGVHAQQVLPVAAVVIAYANLPARRALIWLTAAGWTALALFAFLQAVSARPFPFG